MRKRSGDSMFRLGTGFFGLVLVGIVTAIAFELTRQSMLSIQKFGFNFWRTEIWDPVAGNFGALPFIWGTLYSSILALLLATPIALGIAVFISELSPAALRQPLVFLTELLAAIPSIVYGLWGIFVMVPAVRAFETAMPASLRQWPVLSGPPFGVGMLSAGLILAIMVIPFTSSVAREVLKSVPAAQREGAYALGATRFEAIRAALFYARTGVIGAVMLGFGRALGETMAVTMVIGNNPQVSASLFAPQYTMAAVIANEFAEAAGALYLDALVPLALILFFVVSQGIRALNWSFFTQLPKPVGEVGGGMANSIVGTLILTGLGSIFAVPIGVLSGVYMSEYAGSRFAALIRFAADTLNGVPSIVIGIFAYGVLVLPFRHFSALAGGLALGIMMIPIIARTTEELLLLVPGTMREGALALGATRARAVFSVVLPSALPGIITGVVLALARIAGETAPLLFTAFNNHYFTTALNQPISSLTVQVYTYAISPYADWLRQAWAGALVLVSIVLVCSILARLATRRLETLQAR